jgi:hypothetical protein
LKKRPRSPFKYERSADLWTWLADGAGGKRDAHFEAQMEVSVGVTDNGQMGFIVGRAGKVRILNPAHEEDGQASFVLDREQVAALIELLHLKLPGLRRARGPGRVAADGAAMTARLTPEAVADLERCAEELLA